MDACDVKLNHAVVISMARTTFNLEAPSPSPYIRICTLSSASSQSPVCCLIGIHLLHGSYTFQQRMHLQAFLPVPTTACWQLVSIWVVLKTDLELTSGCCAACKEAQVVELDATEAASTLFEHNNDDENSFDVTPGGTSVLEACTLVCKNKHVDTENPDYDGGQCIGFQLNGNYCQLLFPEGPHAPKPVRGDGKFYSIAACL
jgi:hypothetical protein